MVERYTHLAIGEFPRRFNVAHGQLAPVTCDGVLAGRRWGLLSPWRGHGGVRPPSIYDVSVHALDAKPVLRRARHGLVHADGFYTWRQLPGGKARPFWLHGDGPLMFACLCATHRDDGIDSFALVIGPDGAPLVVTESWLAGVTFEPFAWREAAISRWFQDASHDDDKCIEPLGNPRQLLLI